LTVRCRFVVKVEEILCLLPSRDGLQSFLRRELIVSAIKMVNVREEVK
jgi:hypothetical protein